MAATLIGLCLAYRFSRRRWLVVGLALGGLVAPLVLLVA
jgi:hypothetical protein